MTRDAGGSSYFRPPAPRVSQVRVSLHRVRKVLRVPSLDGHPLVGPVSQLPGPANALESEPAVSSTRKILTLHPPLGDSTIDAILTSLETALVESGASRIWVESESYPDLTVMAEMPELQPEHVERIA
ncbi:hypothetical protein GCM10009844_18030 [Nocardioides koreensis]|uniref:Uncharacterized protein n=1 Tax=Nocardioides koreensis TaxID=433651 RepID=A0ABN2ZME7_9ACTN